MADTASREAPGTPAAEAAEVWWARRQDAAPRLAGLLDDLERQRWSAYRREADRERARKLGQVRTNTNRAGLTKKEAEAKLSDARAQALHAAGQRLAQGMADGKRQHLANRRLPNWAHVSAVAGW